jgi:hypothetical protein
MFAELSKLDLTSDLCEVYNGRKILFRYFNLDGLL